MRQERKKDCEVCSDRVEQVESLSAEVIRTIQSCVDHIRAAFPSTTKQYLHAHSSSVIILDETSKRDIVLRVKTCYQAVDNISLSQSPQLQLSELDFFQSTSDLDKDLDERTTFTQRIILPLLFSLWRCYSILDQVTGPPLTYAYGGKGKPAPPRGLLSLRAYTDIAALLEFMVYKSVLPLLDPNILHKAELRARVLPKAIAGRLPRASLLLGTTNLSDNILASSTRRFQELSWTVVIVGNLVLLDRFRPMLLPRHLADLHAAIFQIEHIGAEQPVWGFDTIRSKLLPSPDCAVESVLLARSYQTLLLHGTSAPLWLRTRVGGLLTDLARTDLTALIQVFVTAAPKEYASGASLRLAQAILNRTSPRNPKECQGSLGSAVCQQVAQLLDGLAGHNASIMSLPNESVLHTVWALVDLIPMPMLLEEKLVNVAHSVDSSEETSRVAQRLMALFSFVPPFAATEKIHRILFTASQSTAINTLDLILAQASTQSVLLSSSKANALNCLQLLVDNVSPKFSARGCSPVNGSEVLASAFVYSLSFNGVAGPNLSRNVAESKFEIECSKISDSSDSADSYVSVLIQDLEQRGRTLVQDVLSPLLKRAETENDKDHAVYPLLASMFTLLLELYLKGNLLIPAPSFREVLPFVPMVTLPILCEYCPMESLLSTHDTAGVLELMAIAFGAASARVNSWRDASLSVSRASYSTMCTGSAWYVFTSILLPQSSQETCNSTHGLTPAADDDMIFSICSLLLSMLIGILELGSLRRPQKDEDVLRSLPPKLLPLASVSNADDSVQIPVELANMASHAATLILARQASVIAAFENDDNEECKTEKTEKFSQIERDLQSSEVPLRARALVQLRHVANALQESNSASPDKGHLQALHLSLGALLDPESFVYLAAIQTIATLADNSPQYIVPILGKAVAVGDIISGTSTNQCIQLFAEQRVKLAEAVISFLRRKAAVNEFLPVLMDAMAFGGRSESFSSSPESRVLIQKTTHEYFTKGSSDPVDASADDVSEKEKWDEIDTRVLTGGPLFHVEESEVVQAAKLSVVAELVTSMEPCILRPYCGILVSCAVDSVRFGVSRPVRRAGALLARELFAALIREHEDHSPSGPREKKIPFTVAMVASHEDWLATALERCLQQNDLRDLSEAKHRLGDPATEARCKEALDLRALAENSGMLTAGRFLYSSESPAMHPTLFEMLREPSRETKSSETFARRLIEKL